QAQLGTFNGTCRVHRAELFRFAGEWDASLAEASRVVAGPGSDRRERAIAAYELAQVHRLRGENAEAQRDYAIAATGGVDPQPGLALLRLAEGDAAIAVGGISRALATTSSPLGRARLLPAAVEIFVAADHRTEAAASARELSDIAERYGTPALRAEARQATGRVLLAGDEAAAAVEPLTDALTGWDALGALYDAARTRILLADAFAALGDAEGARMQREAAQAVFDDLGAPTPADTHRTDAGRGERRILSPREEGVLRLAATGITNKEIAQRLGISTRTVDRHVSNILTKLGVPSRAAATAYAYEHHLLAVPAG
ncbi:MAG TPA: LuxR C-terminal-related transcriptional regulator, partial [Leifsonia sp.]